MLELVGAPNLADDVGALATGGRIVVIGVGAGFKAELNLLALMGKRGTISGIDAARPPAGGEGGGDASASRGRCCRCSRPGASTCRWPRPSRSTRPRQAYDRFTEGGKLGKIVLVTSS